MDEISVTAEHSEISSHHNSRHDAPLRYKKPRKPFPTHPNHGRLQFNWFYNLLMRAGYPWPAMKPFPIIRPTPTLMVRLNVSFLASLLFEFQFIFVEVNVSILIASAGRLSFRSSGPPTRG
jgi:hypothetical protein